jgi:hypothetical protein
VGLVVEKKHNQNLGRPLNKKLWYGLHGAGLLLMLIAGFGLLARLGLASSLPVWVWLKLLIWLSFGALLPVVARLRHIGILTVILLTTTLVSIAAWLALNKLG